MSCFFAERFQDAMTEEEKAKMYSAIGYSENVPDPAFPPDVRSITVAHYLSVVGSSGPWCRWLTADR